MLWVGRVDDFPQQEGADHPEARGQEDQAQQQPEPLAVGVNSREIRRSETGAAGMSSGRCSGRGRCPSPNAPGEKGWALTVLTLAVPARAAFARREVRSSYLRISGSVSTTSLELGPEQIRVLGCLLEKQRTTPDAYPLSLNSLRLACNQSTNRDPVVDYDEAAIRDALHRLERRGLVRLASGAGSRTAKYRHLLAEALPMERAEEAIMCVLMLRGPQTPGELKQRGERMHPFADLGEVHGTLERLIQRGLAERLPRRPGQKEERYRELLGGEEEARPPGIGRRRRRAGAARAAADAAGERAAGEQRRSTERVRGWSARWPSCERWIESVAERAVSHCTCCSPPSSDTATGVGIPVAVAAGLVSFLSPCVLPLVPGYLSTVIGVTPARPAGGRRRPAGARPEPAVHRELLGDLHPARAQRDGDRLGAERAQTDPRAGRRGTDHRDGRRLPRDAVRRAC